MSLIRAGLALAIVGLALAHPLLALAEVRTVEVVGQAAETGLGKAVTRRRALEEALVEAAIQGGADINGYTAISEGVLVSDQLVLRPSSRILDYTVLSESTKNGFYQIRLRAAVGELPPPRYCERRATLDLDVFAPALEVDLSVPAWAAHVQPDLAKAFNAALSSRREVSSVHAATDRSAPGRSAQVGYAMDYAALTSGVRAQENSGGRLGFKASVKLEMVGERLLRMNVTSRLVSAAGRETVAQESMQHDIRLATKLPLRAVNVLLAPDQREIVRQLSAAISGHVGQLIEAFACRSLKGELRYSDGKLTLPFGKKDGLSKLSLAYTEGHDTPYILFDVVRLEAHLVQLAPLDRRRSLASLAGMTVRFMDGAR